MREAVFTVSPNKQYLGIACPTTPVRKHVATINIILHISHTVKSTTIYKSMVVRPVHFIKRLVEKEAILLRNYFCMLTQSLWQHLSKVLLSA